MPNHRRIDSTPEVYRSVRAIGILRPKFQPNQVGKAFIESLDVRGTGFWLKEYKVIITCAHVVDDLLSAPVEITGLLVAGNMGQYNRAIISSLDTEHDLAVLRIVDVSQEFINGESDTGLEIVANYPSVGQKVSYAGFPFGRLLLDQNHAPTYAEGVIGVRVRKNGNRKNIQITGSVAKGFSGSPVVTIDNKLAGVLSESPSKEAGSAGIFMATSWEHVKAIAELAKS